MCVGADFDINDKKIGLYLGYYGNNIILNGTIYKVDNAAELEEELNKWTKEELVQLAVNIVKLTEE